MQASIRSAVVAAVAAMVLSSTTGPGNAVSSTQKTCKNHSHKGEATHKVKSAAVRGAYHNWANVVAAHDGAIWASTKTTSGTSFSLSCAHITINSQHPWQCVVNARPCRMVLTNPGATRQMPPLITPPWTKRTN